MLPKCIQVGEDVWCRVSNSRLRYEQVGLLMNDHFKNPLPLYGVRTARTSPDWYYYTHTQTEPPLRVPLIARKRNCLKAPRGCDELSDGDTVSVQGYPEGTAFRVTLFDSTVRLTLSDTPQPVW